MEKDYVGGEWFDILPHVIDDLAKGVFQMPKTYEVRYKKPVTEKDKKLVYVVVADSVAHAKQEASLLHVGYVSNRLVEMLKATEVREEEE